MATKYKVLIALCVIVVIGVVWVVWHTTVGAEPAARAFITALKTGASTHDMMLPEVEKSLGDPASEATRAYVLARNMPDPDLEVRTSGFWRWPFIAYACVAASKGDAKFYVVLEKQSGKWWVAEFAQTMPHACDGGD